MNSFPRHHNAHSRFSSALVRFISASVEVDHRSGFGPTYIKIGTIQRRLAWPLRKDDTQIREAFQIFDEIYKYSLHTREKKQQKKAKTLATTRKTTHKKRQIAEKSNKTNCLSQLVYNLFHATRMVRTHAGPLGVLHSKVTDKKYQTTYSH